MFEQLRSLYEAQLWSNLVHLAPIALAFCNSNQDADQESKCCRKRHQILVMIADAYLECKEFRKAENVCKDAIQMRKQLKSAKKSEPTMTPGAGPASDEMSPLDLMASDVEVKYKLHKCYLSTNQGNQAVTVLQSIPAKQRNSKCNMALGTLYQQAEMERPAIACFKEVLKVCPLSLEAAQKLMQLGSKAREIQEVTIDLTSGEIISSNCCIVLKHA